MVYIACWQDFRTSSDRGRGVSNLYYSSNVRMTAAYVVSVVLLSPADEGLNRLHSLMYVRSYHCECTSAKLVRHILIQ